MSRGALLFISITIGASAFIGAALADKIGVASVVVNQVQANARALAVGSEVFSSERVRTGETSSAQLLFLDKTSLSIGPHAEIVLDRFVYNPQKGIGQVVLNATQGAFRFITGSQNPNNYSIKTPVANIGIRGTILDLLITGNVTTGYTLTMVLDECCADLTLPTGQVLHMTRPGTAYTINSAGLVTGPLPWEGTIIHGGGVQFPLYGWYFNGEPPPNGLPSNYAGNIDQLNAVIADQLSHLTSPGGGHSCQGESCNNLTRTR
jgi:hypothetical protein